MLKKLFATTAMVALMTTGALAADQNATKDMTKSGQPVFSQDAGKDMTSDTGYFEAATSQILASNLLGATVYTEQPADQSAAMGSDSASDGYGTANQTTATQDRVAEPEKTGDQQQADANATDKNKSMDSGDRTAETLDGNEAATGQAARQTAMMDNFEAVGDVNDVVMGESGQAEAVVIGVGGFLGIGEKNVAVDFNKLSWVERDGERWLMISASREELDSAPAFDTAAITGERSAQDRMASKDGSAMDRMAGNDQTGDQTGDAANQPERMAATDSNGAVDNETTAAVNRDGWSATQTGEISAENLLGTSVYGANDDDLGEIGDVILTADGAIEAYVIDVGGFLGIGEKPVALDAKDLQIMQNGDGDFRIFTQFTQEQLENQPAYDASSYASNRDQMLMR